MPWKETGPVFERIRFIDDYLSGCGDTIAKASRDCAATRELRCCRIASMTTLLRRS